MIQLFNLPRYKIPLNKSNNILSGGVDEFEKKFADFVGAKYACGVNSATNAIFLSLFNKKTTITVPSILPPVVVNAIIQSGNEYRFNDNIKWIGHSYILHNFGNYKIIDSAQETYRNQFKEQANPQDLMIFSFYPTKPISGIDGAMIVSDDKDKIDWFKEAVNNGTSQELDSWERSIKFPGWKMYLSFSQAHVANKSLEKLEEKQAQIKQNRDFLNSSLGYHNTSLHLYRISVLGRDNLIKHRHERGITCGVHYRALHKHPVYRISDDLLMQSDAVSNTTLTIPFHEKLTSGDLAHITKCLKN